MLDLMKPPYNLVPEFHYHDYQSTDVTNLFEDAIGAAATKGNSGALDNGGQQGDRIVIPAGCYMISRPLTLPTGVELVGSNYIATILRTKEASFDPTKHMITLGEQSGFASFGVRLKNLTLLSKQQTVGYGACMVYTNNVQDTWDMLSSVRLYSYGRWGVRCEKGFGGASFVHMRNVITATKGPNTIGMHINYAKDPLDSGATQVILEGIEPNADPGTGLAGTVGLYAKGGRFNIKGFHPEIIESGIVVDLQGSASRFKLESATGGATYANVLVMGNENNRGKIKLSDMHQAGTPYNVLNGLSGGQHVQTDIDTQLTI